MKNKIIFKTLMLKGEAGSTIVSMEKTGHVGTADIYTITFNDGSTTEISLENMSAITSVEKTSSTDTEDIYTITCADGSTQTFSVLNHNADIAAMSDDIDTIDARVDNFINSVVPNTIETLWTGSIKEVGDSATLSKAVSNFDYIDLYLLGSADSKYIRVPATQAVVEIQQQNLSDDASSNFLRLWEMGVSISGTTVSITKSIAWAWDTPGSADPTVTANAQNGVPITRIDGVKVASDTPAELTDIRVGANGITYASAGDAVRGQYNQLNDSLTQLSDDVIGEASSVELTEISGMLVDSSGILLAGTSYACFVFAMKPEYRYDISASGNEVLRIARSNTDGNTSRQLEYVYSSSDISKYSFVNDMGYAYCYLFGKTPQYSNAVFTVTETAITESINGDINTMQNDIKNGVPVIGNYHEYIDTGAKGCSGGYVSNINGVFKLECNGPNTYCNLGDFDANENLKTNAAYTSAESNTFEAGDIIHCKVDVAISSTTFAQFALGLKTPNTSTTKYTFFNVSKTDLVNGRYTFDGYALLEENDKFSVPFIYIYDTSATRSNPITIEGTISVTKYQQNIDKIEQFGETFYFSIDNRQSEFISRGNAKTIGKLHKNGKYIVDADNTPVELRGVGLHALLQYPNLHYRKPFESLRYMGCNLIRVSVYLEDFAFSASDGEVAFGYLSHPTETKAEIEKIIHNCIDLGLYVLLDWHVMDYQEQVVGQKYTGTGILHQTEAEEFFEYFSSKYADCPNILYELTNEPYNLEPADMIPYLQAIRTIITNNVVNPVMIAGVGKPIIVDGERDYSVYLRSKALIDELETNGITDIFASPHIYGSALGQFQQLWNEDIPYFVSEWGNSGSSGDGAGNDTNAVNQINWLHSVAVGQSLWKFTDQTMTSSLLANQGVINSEKYFFGIDDSGLSHNGTLLLRGRYYSFVRSEWIDRTPLT